MKRGAEDVNSGETVAVRAEKVAAVASHEEVGVVNGGVTFPAEEGGVGGAVERSLLIAELASPLLHLHDVVIVRSLTQERI